MIPSTVFWVVFRQLIVVLVLSMKPIDIDLSVSSSSSSSSSSRVVVWDNSVIPNIVYTLLDPFTIHIPLTTAKICFVES